MPETFLDSSPNALTITASGNVAQGTFSPFTGNTTGHYSAYFDGNGDYLSFADNTAFDIGLSGQAFTWETWVNISNVSVDSVLGLTRGGGFGGWNSTNGIQYHVLIQSNTLYWQYWSGSALTSISVANPIPSNTWTHVAVCYDGTTTRLFVNGTVVASSTNGYAKPSSSNITRIGVPSTSTTSAARYESDFRLIKGTALYTANFTPPTSKLTAVANTALLTLQDSTFVDNSTNAFTITRNGDVGIDSFSPYMLPGGIAATTEWSTVFDGTGDYLTTSSNASMDFGTGAFTIEGWIKTSVKTISVGASRTIIGNSGNGYTLQLYVNISSGVLTFGNTGTTFIAGTSDVANDQWNHFAIVRENTSANGIKMYINGVLQATGTNSQNYTSGTIYIGAFDNANGFWNGHISNLRIVKGAAVYTSNFTPSTTKLTAIANTALLTCQDASVRDNSSNNYTITRNGDAAASAVNPFPAGAVSSDNFDVLPGSWSGYFDGTGDYLTVPDNAAFDFASSDFSIEACIYPTTAGTVRVICSHFSGADGFSFELDTSNQLKMWIENNYVLTGSSAVVANAWNHVAVTRSGTTLRLFLNGTQVGSVTNSTAIAGSTSTFAVGATPSGTALFTGYISNLRVLKGTAVYTANFVPPTGRLNAIANTALLILQDNRFKDNSIYNHTITRNGDTAISTFSPFDNITSGLFSNYFDGTVDFLRVTGSSPNNFSSDNFTIEGWYYPTGSAANGAALISKRLSGATDGFALFYNNAGLTPTFRVWQGGSATGTSSSLAFTANTWNHFAVTRSGTSLKMFINGQQGFSTTLSGSIDSNNSDFCIGAYDQSGNGNISECYMSNVRVLLGTAIYTSAFTPSTTALTPVANTIFLTCQSARLKDNGPLNRTITRNGDVKVSSFAPFPVLASYTKVLNGGSMYFDGTGDSLSLSGASGQFNFGSSPFTIEMWINPSQTDGQIFSFDNSKIELRIQASSGNAIRFYFLAGGNQDAWTTIGTVKLNEWSHIAIVGNGPGLTCYYNGVSVGGNYQGSFSNVTTLTIGGSGSYPTQYKGYIADIRITKGRAVYKANFMPPRQPATPTTNTSLLLSGTNTSFNDYSGKAVTETVGSIALNSTNKKFGTNSISTGTSGANCLRIADAPELRFGTGNFTIEGWFKPLPGMSGIRFFYQKGVNAAGGLLLGVSTENIIFRSAGANDLSVNVSVSTTDFTHIAFVRAGTTRYIFVNGTLSGSDTLSFNVNDTSVTEIGAVSGPASDANKYYGYIDDLRITRAARYTANFTAPVAAFGTKGE